MSLNTTPVSDRLHIALFGRRNAGKSSLINALTGQEIAVVSPVKGTTTDPVYKAMELLPIGPVVFVDTAGLDDIGELGELRRKKSIEVLHKTDIALVVVDRQLSFSQFEKDVIAQIKERKIPIIGVINKIDVEVTDKETVAAYEKELGISFIPVSAAERKGIRELKNAIIEAAPKEEDKFSILGDLISPGDLVVLVVPIDKAAPKGRLILPQQQTIRDILECDAMAIVTKEFELKETLESLKKKPRLVITDSQVFLKVSADTPKDIPLTSFSILFARHKGNLLELVKGTKAIEQLQDGDKVLIAEACTHHAQSDDIGKVKIPRWLRQRTGKQIEFEFANGMTFPDNLTDYKLIVHCGGCMLNKKAMGYRVEQAVKAGIPIVNYGVLIAYVQGILPRSITPFPGIKALLDEE